MPSMFAQVITRQQRASSAMCDEHEPQIMGRLAERGGFDSIESMLATAARDLEIRDIAEACEAQAESLGTLATQIGQLPLSTQLERAADTLYTTARALRLALNPRADAPAADQPRPYPSDGAAS